jgi:hypothetical protein
MNQRPLYRPDKLGVIIQCDGSVLALFEVVPGALQSQQVEYIKRRLRGTMMVSNYPVGVLDGFRVTPDMVHEGGTELDPAVHEWEELGGNEYILRRTSPSGRIPLPLAG